MSKTYKYFGFQFDQQKHAPPAVLFIAPAEEISSWGGVPQKSARYMKGFQRAEQKIHWQEVSEFFEDPHNISPTAIVVAFKPKRVRIEQLNEVPLDSTVT